MQSSIEIYRNIRAVQPQFRQKKKAAKPKTADFKRQLSKLTPEQLAEVLALIATE